MIVFYGGAMLNFILNFNISNEIDRVYYFDDFLNLYLKIQVGCVLPYGKLAVENSILEVVSSWCNG